MMALAKPGVRFGWRMQAQTLVRPEILTKLGSSNDDIA
jgi:hypothetical protein